MSTRSLVVLGTASQVPTRYRNHNGMFVLWDGIGLLIDPGEGIQRQMIRCGLSASQIHRILITHFHGDHCLGLPGIIQRCSLDNVAHPVSVHFPASGRKYFDRLRYASIYMERATILPQPITEPGEIARTPRYTLHTDRLSHGVESFDVYGFLSERYEKTTPAGALIQPSPEELNKLQVTAQIDSPKSGASEST